MYCPCTASRIDLVFALAPAMAVGLALKPPKTRVNAAVALVIGGIGFLDAAIVN